MAIGLTKEALEYYILTCLSIEDMYGAQILETVSSAVSIKSTSLYELLDVLEEEGKITKIPTAVDGVSCNLCSITALGQNYLNAFLKAR